MHLKAPTLTSDYLPEAAIDLAMFEYIRQQYSPRVQLWEARTTLLSAEDVRWNTCCYLNGPGAFDGVSYCMSRRRPSTTLIPTLPEVCVELARG